MLNMYILVKRNVEIILLTISVPSYVQAMGNQKSKYELKLCMMFIDVQAFINYVIHTTLKRVTNQILTRKTNRIK